MAKKLNTKLVFVVGSLTLLVLFGGAGIFAVRWRYDADRHIRAGDELVAAGNFSKAAEAYGRAVGKKPNNVAYLDKYKEALLLVVPDTESEARERYSQLIQVLATEAKVSRDDVARWRDFLAAAREQAEASDSTIAWKSLSDRCDEMQHIVRPGEICESMARLYRGYAGLRRVDSLNDTERASALADLNAALANEAVAKGFTDAERDLALASIARLMLVDLARAKASGQEDRIAAAETACALAMTVATTASPIGVETAIASFERQMLQSAGNSADPALAAPAMALADAAIASNNSVQTLEAVSVLLRGGKGGYEQALRIFAPFIEKNPSQLMHRRAYAQLLRLTDRPAALAQLDLVMNAPRPSTGLVAAIYQSNLVSSAQLRFDILFEQLDQASDDERDAAMVSVMAARTELSKLFEGATDDSALLRADGKLMLAKKDNSGAVFKFNEVFKRGSQVDLELYILAALANVGVGETGRGLELVNAGLQTSPGSLALLKMRADLEYRSGRLQQAMATAQLVLLTIPDDEACLRIVAAAKSAVALDPATAGASDPFVASMTKLQTLVEAKDFDRARAMLVDLRKNAPVEDARVDRISVALEIQAGDNAAALRYVEEGLRKFPGDPAMARFKAVLSSDDPVDRMVALAESSMPDSNERPVVIYVQLREAARTVQDKADSEARLGQASAAQNKITAEKLRAGAVLWRQKAEQADAAHPMILECDFLDAIDRGDFAAATACVNKAKESGRDRAQPSIMEARILIKQEKHADAARVLEQAIQSGLDASTMYRALGVALEQSGNLEGSIRQYEDAYQRRPSDMMTVRSLVGSLIRSGNPQRALEVLRQARNLAGLDDEIGELWLGLEAQLGDRRLAQQMRENRYSMLSSDNTNAIKLANLLALSSPDRLDILNEDGTPRYNETQWRGLDAAARVAAVDRMRTTWRVRADEIFIAIATREPANLDAAASHATLLRAVGRPVDAEKVMVAAVTAAGASAGWRGYAMLGQLQTVLGFDDNAQLSFAEAMRVEDPQSREATKAIISMLADSNRHAQALVFLEPLCQSSPSSENLLRLSEILLRVGRVEDARTTFDTATKTATRDVSIELIDGAIWVGLGDKLRMSGDAAAAVAAYEQALPKYAQAKKLVPSSPGPYVQDAMLKRKLFEISGDPRRGEEALAVATRAVAVGAAFLPASAARAEVLIALGDVNGAVAELERFLAILPVSVEARRRLIDILVQTSRFPQAEETLNQAIGLAPGEPAWHYALGEMYVRSGRYAEAATAFARADTLQNDEPVFYRELDARLRARDYRGIIEAARRRGELVRSSNTGQTYLGLALLGQGDREEGTRTVTRTYKEAQAAFAAGDGAMMSDWFGAVRVLFGAQDFAAAEALVRQASGGELSPYGREYLAGLALEGSSDGSAKAIEILAPLENEDFSKNARLGAVVLERLATALYATGDCARSVGIFEKALALSPDADPLLNNYAYLCGECLKDAKKGLPSARRAVQLQPMRAEYLDTLATLLLADQQPKEALAMLDRAAKILDSAPIQYHRAQAILALGDKEAARLAAEKALTMNPDPATKASLEAMAPSLK